MAKKSSGFMALAAAMSVFSALAQKAGALFGKAGKSVRKNEYSCPPRDYGMYLISHNIYHRRGKKRCRK